MRYALVIALAESLAEIGLCNSALEFDFSFSSSDFYCCTMKCMIILGLCASADCMGFNAR